MRILVSKPDSLGDQLVIARHLQALASANPDALVLWHVRDGMEDVASLFSGVSVFHPNLGASPGMEADRLQSLHCAGLVLVPIPLHPFAEWTSVTEEHLAWWRVFLESQPWDAAVAAVGNRTWVAEASIAAARAPIRIGAAPTTARQIPVNAAGELIGACSPLFTVEIPFDPETSEDCLLRKLLQALPHSGAIAWDLPAKLKIPISGTTSNAGQIILAPGVGGPAWRAWPADKYLELDARLRKCGWSVTYLAGPLDSDFLKPIRETPGKDIRTFARGDLVEISRLLQQGAALVCNDTAYVHLAALLNVPTLAVFGGGQKQRFHPQTGRVKIVQGLPACAGCQWHCVFERYPCVSDIPVDLVMSALNALMRDHDSTLVPFAPSWSGERSGATLVSRLQEEILFLDSDRFARLQIIQSLLDKQRQSSLQPAPGSNPPGATPLLSVVIPMGRPESAGPTLAALASQVPPGVDWEVVVAGAGESRIPSNFAGLTLARVVLPNRAPPSQTRNAGVTHARGKWLVFIDDDIQPAIDFLACAVALLRRLDEENPTVSAIGARLPGRRGGFWERVTDLSNFWSQQDRVARDCDWLYSAALLVKADAFRATGGFDPQLAVGEDVDLCRRLAAQGHRLRYEPSLVAYHDHRRDSAFRTWRYFWRNGEGARFFFRSIGGTCAFSLKTVWLKTWSDFRGNLAHQKRYGGKLGRHAPAVWLNYLIVETSLEWHWQRHLRDGRRYADLPARTRSDATAARALSAFDNSRPIRGAWLSLIATLQDFANPVRR